MRVYYFISEEAQKGPAHKEIYRALSQKKAEVFSNVDSFNTGKLSSQERTRLEETGEFFVGKMNAVVVEASSFSSEVGYVLALAISQRLRVLYLHKSGTKLNQALSLILEGDQARKLVTVMEYEEGALPEVIDGFIKKFDAAARREKPTIKFTLRITPRLSRYLDWKSARERKSKADHLREDILEEMMDSDAEFQAHQAELSQGS